MDFQLASVIRDAAEPVSNSIGRAFPMTTGCSCIGAADRDEFLITNRGISSSWSPVCIAWLSLWFDLRKGCFSLDLHAGAIWPTFPHFWHFACLNLQSSALWLFRPQRWHLRCSDLSSAAFSRFCFLPTCKKVELDLSCSSFACLPTASIPWGSSDARARVNPSSARSFFCIASLRTLHTNRSRNASSRKFPNLHVEASFFSTARYSAIDSSVLWSRGRNDIARL